MRPVWIAEQDLVLKQKQPLKGLCPGLMPPQKVEQGWAAGAGWVLRLHITRKSIPTRLRKVLSDLVRYCLPAKPHFDLVTKLTPLCPQCSIVYVAWPLLSMSVCSLSRLSVLIMSYYLLISCLHLKNLHLLAYMLHILG